MFEDHDDVEEEGEEGAPAWMATFSDLATLLLTFFVLLLSFANMDIQNFRTAMGSVKEAMGVQVKLRGDYEALASSPVEMSTVQSQNFISVSDLAQISDAAARLVKKLVKERNLEGKVEVVGTSRGIALRTRDNVLFDPGSADVEARGTPTLELVAELMASFEGEVEVQGHTDDVPTGGKRFPSNWELSTARSIAVLRALADTHGIDEARLHVAGYADKRPVAPMETAEGRAKNRRVEFLFEYPLQEEGKGSAKKRAGFSPPPSPSSSATTSASASPAASASAPQ
ncbi:MAG: OmpA family protein [Myxococcota bacterium]